MSETSVQPEASTVSTGLGLRYVGEWVYAYSGRYEAKTDKQTVLDTTSGSGIIVCRINFNGFVHENVPGTGTAGMAEILFNDLNISILRSESGALDAPYTVYEKFVIPPFTKVKVTVDADSDSGQYWGSVNLVGRVYGAE